jgi:arginyl-tRNA synthetase
MLLKIKNKLSEIISSEEISIDDIEVDILYDDKGDFTSNIALKFAKLLKKNPREFAKEIISQFNLEEVEKIEIAGPGFINFFIKDIEFLNLQQDSQKTESKYGNINVEFVSANPTGPLHLAHGRGAIVGDVLSNLFEYFGHKVTREYYVNNTGNQINEFLSSVIHSISTQYNLNLSYQQFYKGEYIQDIAQDCYLKFKDKFTQKTLTNDDELEIVNFAIDNLVNQSISILKNVGIHFSTISYETEIMKKNYLSEIINNLSNKKLIRVGQLNMPKDYQDTKKDNEITIFNSTVFGDDEDRAITKNDGTPTYFANDIAYHVDKHKRGFSKLINIWGADHLGYLKRLSAALTSLYPEIDFSVVFCQIVNLKRNNQIQKLSKREGNIFELKDLIDEIGVDNFRYFMCYRKNDTHMDLDIDLIKKENKENPIYYIQYSYARAQSVLDKANKIISSKTPITADVKNLYKKLLEWDSIVFYAYKKTEVQIVAHYLESLASFFHTLWSSAKNNPAVRFLDDDGNISEHFHSLITNYQSVLKKGLNILGIEPKLKM